MGDRINESDIYSTFRKKGLEEKLKPDEKIISIMGCPTIIKKGWLERKITSVKKILFQ